MKRADKTGKDGKRREKVEKNTGKMGERAKKAKPGGRMRKKGEKGEREKEGDKYMSRGITQTSVTTLPNPLNCPDQLSLHVALIPHLSRPVCGSCWFFLLTMVMLKSIQRRMLTMKMAMKGRVTLEIVLLPLARCNQISTARTRQLPEKY